MATPEVSADQSLRSTGPLELDQALELARSRDATLSAAQLAVRASEAAEDAEAAWDNPEFRVRTLRFDDYFAGDQGVELAIRAPIPMPGRLAASRAVAVAATRAERAAVWEAAALVDVVTRTLYREAQLLHAESLAAQVELDARRRLQQSVRQEVEAGSNTSLELARRDLDLAEVEADVLGLERRKEHNLRALAEQTGRASLRIEDLVTPLPRPDSDPIAAQWQASLVEDWANMEPEIEAAAAAMDAAEADLWLERSEAWPWFRFVQMSYDWQTGAPAGEAWAVQVSFIVPLFSQNAGGIERARAERLRSEVLFDAAVRQEKRGRDDSVAALELAAAEWHDVVRGPLVAAQNALDEATRAEQGAVASLAQLLEVEVKVASARRREVDALRRYCEARIALVQGL